ncbi:MAG: methyltransferase domain-containing protein [Actinomycetota bacterium]|nr:methyltransferase domain-containing protein [Actinomycetota bacterium]
MNKKIIDKKIFRCPECGNKDLLFEEGKIKCSKCGASYRVDDNKYFFVEKLDCPEDFIDKLKYRFKRFSGFYTFLIKVISPVFTYNQLGRFVKAYVRRKNGSFLNLGSGNRVLSPEMINVDILPYKNVDIIADIQNLPVADGEMDIAVCSAVLEHVKDPYRVVNEIYRVLKKGGLTYCYMPFICGFHASPDDYTRLTYEGMKVLFKDFDIVELGVGGGPTSGLLWVLQEWLATLLSFGSRRLHFIFYVFFMLITFPIKYLDIILSKFPTAKNIASGFYIIARKKGDET